MRRGGKRVGKVGREQEKSRAGRKVGGEQRQGDSLRAASANRKNASWGVGRRERYEGKIAEVTGASGTCGQGSPTLLSSAGLKRVRSDYLTFNPVREAE